MKKMKVFITSVLLSSALSITALAGEWKQDDIGWWYQNDDGSYTTDTWQNIEEMCIRDRCQYFQSISFFLCRFK